MTVGPLRYVSEAKLRELRESVEMNRVRYTSDGFCDLETENGWAIEATSVEVDYEALKSLDGTTGSAGDLENSLLLHGALKGMTPALAREERVWVRMAHIEALEYCRCRWLSGCSEEALDAAVRLHVFAPKLTGIRDDHALSRLWWNVHVASIANPNAPDAALAQILKTADIRQAFVERSRTASRRPLATAIVRAMETDPWLTRTERAFREFMIVLNRDAGGILFEALSATEADAVVRASAIKARRHVTKAVD